MLKRILTSQPRLFSLSFSSSSRAVLEALEAARDNADRSSKKPIQLKGIRHDGTTRRFFGQCGVEEITGKFGRSVEFAPMLGGRPIESSLGNLVAVPSRALASALALEFQSQIERIIPSTMPLMNLTINAIDLARADKAAFLNHFNGSIAVDAILTRVEEPPALAKLQKKHWDPIVKFAAEALGVSLTSTTALHSPDLSDGDKEKIRLFLSAQDEFALAALDNVTTVTKSVLIAIALLSGRLSVPSAAEAARVDENYQMKQYGRVEGIYGHGVEIEFSRMQIAASRSFLELAQNK